MNFNKKRSEFTQAMIEAQKLHVRSLIETSEKFL